MKITIDIDCTPQEVRAFLGLPHIEPMQDALIARMQERLAKSLETMDPDALMRLWLPGGVQGLAEIQERFWNQLMSGMAGAAGGAGKSKRRSEHSRSEGRQPVVGETLP